MPLPHGPTSPPLLQFSTWLRDPLGFLDRTAARYGETFTMRLPGLGPMVIVSNPRDIKTLFSNPAMSAPGDPDLRPLLGDNSVLLLSGDEHRERRRILMPPFHGSRMTGWGHTIDRLTRDVAARWQAGQLINVRDTMREITLNVMLEIVFGAHDQEDRQTLRIGVGRRMAQSATLGGTLPLWLTFLQRDWGTWKKVQATQRACDEIFHAEIAAARRRDNDIQDPSILGLLCRATHADGSPLEDIEIRDELMMLMVAGHENVTSSLSWALYWLQRHPLMRERVMAELDTLGDPPDPIAVSRLAYLDAFCNETLRLYPPAMLTLRRQTTAPVELGGVMLEPRTQVWGSIYLAHRRAATFANPADFDPERFVGSDYSLFEFMPFGGGARRCVGMALAMFEMKLILAALLACARFTLVSDEPVKPRRRTGLLAPDPRLAMRVEPIAAKVELSMATADQR
jgi:cytochrome P450